MRGSAWYGRVAWLVVLPLGAAAGCQDVGLADRNTPEAEASERDFRYVVYDAAGATGGSHDVVTEMMPAAGGMPAAARSQHWLATAERVQIPASLIQAVGGSGESALYALTWDSAPYERLFAASAERDVYHPLHAVPPVATPVDHGTAAEDHGTGH
jgi:hypothetical protein